MSPTNNRESVALENSPREWNNLVQRALTLKISASFQQESQKQGGKRCSDLASCEQLLDYFPALSVPDIISHKQWSLIVQSGKFPSA